MTDKKLTDKEIIKEIQGIKESMKRHIDLTNEMGQDLLHIDEEYTGGSKVWLTTDYFKKVVKHFAHSNYLVKCLELILEYINRLQAKAIKEQNKNSKLRNERNRLQAQNKDLAETVHNLTIEKDALFDKAEELKAEIERLKRELDLVIENSISARYPHCVLCGNGVILTKSLEEYDELIADISAEAYKEFAEKAKEFMHNKFKTLDEYEFEYITERDIDKLAKRNGG